MRVSISKGNEKLGSIQSVSLPSGITCKECGCRKKCYARRIEQRRKSVRDAYQNNLTVLNKEPDTYWREVEAAIMLSRYFRFHVSGDIPNQDYLSQMSIIARRNQHCEILCFTKRYEFVNEHIRFLKSIGSELPGNLHIILSAWPGIEMVNPFLLPEAHIRFRNGATTARKDAKECSGNCSECAITDEGCWTLRLGEQVIFNEH